MFNRSISEFSHCYFLRWTSSTNYNSLLWDLSCSLSFSLLISNSCSIFLSLWGVVGSIRRNVCASSSWLSIGSWPWSMWMSISESESSFGSWLLDYDSDWYLNIWWFILILFRFSRAIPFFKSSNIPIFKLFY